MLSEQISNLILQIIEIMPAAAIYQLASDLETCEEPGNKKSPADAEFQSLSKISERIPNPNARYLTNKLQTYHAQTYRLHKRNRNGTIFDAE
jgi:hypothetical protein